MQARQLTLLNLHTQQFAQCTVELLVLRGKAEIVHLPLLYDERVLLTMNKNYRQAERQRSARLYA